MTLPAVVFISQNKSSRTGVRQARDMASDNRSSYSTNDQDYEPYVPVAQRKRAKYAAYTLRDRNTANENHEEEDQAVPLDPEVEEDLKRERGRHEKTLLLQAQDVRQQKDAAGG